MKRLILTVSSALFAAVTFATTPEEGPTYHFIAGKTDWQSPDSYTETAGTENPPPAGDSTHIVLASGVSAVVSSASDYAWLSARGSVRPEKGSTFTCVCEAGTTNTLACGVYLFTGTKSSDGNWTFGGDAGTFVKEGAGGLRLTHPGTILTQYKYRIDYSVDLHIKGGTVFLYSGVTSAYEYKARDFTLDAGTTLIVPECPKHVFCEVISTAEGSEITREGTSTTAFGLRPSGVCNLYGKITGCVNFCCQGTVNLWNEENTFTGVLTVYGNAGVKSSKGVLGIKKFGTSHAASSIGYPNYIPCGEGSNNNMLLRYLGTGETVTDRQLAIYTTHKSPFILDAGATGGLEFTMAWLNWSHLKNTRLVLTDSGAQTPSILHENLFPWEVQDGSTNVFQVTKQGVGTWTFNKSTGTTSGLGLVAVEEGTLRFDNLKERGVNSALGTSLVCYEGTDETATVPYAFRLGGATSTNSVFEYTGSEAVKVQTRPIALMSGDSHLRSSGTQPIKLRGVGGISSGAHTLVLDGDNTDENTVSTISNGVGTVSVVKAGSGSWTLSGEQSFTGTLDVRAGTLNLLSPASYTFFRLNIKETLWGCPRYEAYRQARGGSEGKSHVALGEFALYDTNGIRQNLNFTDGESEALFTAGQAAFGNDKRPAENATCYWYNELWTLFNGSAQSEGSSAEFYCRNPNGDFVKDDPATWMPIELRLTNGTPEIAYYDLGYSYGTNTANWGSCRCITAYSIDASADGFVWDCDVAKNDAVEVRATGTSWLSDGKQFWSATATQGMRNVTGNGDCFPLRGAPTTAIPFLTGITAFKVARGARVTASGKVALPSGIAVTIDASGSGADAVVSGVSFPSSGTLDITGLSSGATELPIICTDESFANLANWPITFNGKRRPSMRLCVKNGRLVVQRLGLIIMTR